MGEILVRNGLGGLRVRHQGEAKYCEVVGWASQRSNWKEGVMWRGKGSEGCGASQRSTWVAVEEYSGTSSVVVYSTHILDFNQRRDE